jgi:hypothetical protein
MEVGRNVISHNRPSDESARSGTIPSVRRALIAIVLLSAACRRDAATGTAPAGRPSGPAAEAVRPIPGHPSGVSDEELAAFTRWQRDHMDLLRRHLAELEAVGSDDPNLVLRDPKAIEARAAQVAARQAPVMKAHMNRLPLKGEKAELVTEAIGGIFHFDNATMSLDLVIARDEVRLDAARRRFGREAIDDIVAREPLVLTALREP